MRRNSESARSDEWEEETIHLSEPVLLEFSRPTGEEKPILFGIFHHDITMLDNFHFYGCHNCKMDANFRITLPRLWRPEVGASFYLMSVERHGMRVLNVCNQAGLDEKLHRIDASDLPMEKISKMRQILAMLNREVVLDDGGRFRVPLDSRSPCGLTANAEVALVGRYFHFEIWNKANFEIMREIEAREMRNDDALGLF